MIQNEFGPPAGIELKLSAHSVEVRVHQFEAVLRIQFHRLQVGDDDEVGVLLRIAVDVIYQLFQQLMHDRTIPAIRAHDNIHDLEMINSVSDYPSRSQQLVVLVSRAGDEQRMVKRPFDGGRTLRAQTRFSS
jgi:hypothetical protein